MLPVLVLLSFATTQGVFALKQKTASAADLQSNKIRVHHSPSASFANNQSIPDNDTTEDSPNHNINIKGGCKRCGVKPPPVKGTLEYRLRVEMIKRQILDKLRMDEEPRIQRPKQGIPLPLVNEKFLETSLVREDVAEKNKSAQVILTGTKAISSQIRKNTRVSRKMLFDFHFSNKIYNTAIVSATLWVYRPKVRHNKVFSEQTLKVVDYESNISKGSKTILKSIKKRLESKDQGWVSVDVKTIVDMWMKRTFKNKSRNHTNIIYTLQISGTQRREAFGSRGEYRPFMVLDLASSKGSSRKKRAINCRPGMKDCCRQEFYVSFKDMGWHNWIMAPLGFNANYCTGSCYGHILPIYHHTDILQKVAMLKQQREIAPCCSPTKLYGLSLIYFDKDENLFHENVPNMIVEECGCS